MIRWLKQREMAVSWQCPETWVMQTDKDKRTYPVSVTYHKALDTLGLKLDIVENFHQKVEERIRDKRHWLTEKNLESVEICPICGAGIDFSDTVMDLSSTQYVCCRECRHVYLTQRLTCEPLEAYWKSDANANAMYADHRIIKKRLDEVAVPKLQWALAQYKAQYGRLPKSILDIGSGAGHFIKAARDHGFKADGIEISSASRIACKDLFDIELINMDFADSLPSLGPYEMVTFWGVLGLVYSPCRMLSNAFACLKKSPEGMVIASVPKWNALGTSIQKIYTESIIRHMNVLGHIHIYSEPSLATAFVNAGFSPCAAWYYDMDIYELVMQLAFHTQKPELIEQVAPHINLLQETIDNAGLSDEIALAGTN